MNIAWRAQIGPPTVKFAVLALADWCDDQGGSLWPSHAALGARIGVSRSQAQRIIRGLIETGVLSVIANAKGGAPGSTPHYRLHLDRLTSMAQTADEPVARTDSADATPRAETGSMDATPTGSASATPSPKTDSADATPTGSTGAAPRGETGSTHAVGRVAPMQQTGSAGATQSPMYLEKEEINTARASPESKPGRRPARDEATEMSLADFVADGLSEATAKEWIAHRRARKAGLGWVAWGGQKAAALKAGLAIEEAISFALTAGWQTFNAKWYANATKDRADGDAGHRQHANPLHADEPWTGAA